MKNRTTTEKACGLAALILSLVLVFGTAFVFHACGAKDDGTYMNCHNAQNAVVFVGVVLAILSVAAMRASSRTTVLVLRGITVIGCIVAALLPQTIIHMCMMNDMRCQAVMRPAVILVSVLLLLVSAVQIVLTAGRKGAA